MLKDNLGNIDNGPVLIILFIITGMAVEIFSGGGVTQTWLKWPLWAKAVSLLCTAVVFILLTDVLFGILFFAVFLILIWIAANVEINTGKGSSGTLQREAAGISAACCRAAGEKNGIIIVTELNPDTGNEKT